MTVEKDIDITEKFSFSLAKDSFLAAIPVMLGYVAIGIPCGILSSAIGMNWWQALIFSILFYSGAGQFMVPNMFLAGADLISTIASVSFVNTRQMLYSAALSPWCSSAKKSLFFWYMFTVTDETFGIAISRYKEGEWTLRRGILLNEFSHASWTISTVVGVLIGPAFNIPLVIASFAMTSLFICLLVSSLTVKPNIIAALCAFIAVIFCKFLNLGGFCIFIGAIVGVAVGLLYSLKSGKQQICDDEGAKEVKNGH